MKNLTLSILLLSLFVAPFAKVSAQTVNKSEVTHWSLGLKGGANYFRVYPFDGDRADRFGWFPALSLEYSVNPIFGIGLEGSFHNYGKHYQELDYQGQTIDGILYGTVNMANLFSPRRSNFWAGFNAYAELGAGVGVYRTNPANEGYSDFSVTPAGVAGVTIEFPLGRMWGLNIGAHYRMYYDDAMGGEALGAYRDYTDALTASLGLRYKFAAYKKKHVRNMTQDEFYPAPSPVVVVDNIPDDEVTRRMRSLEDSDRANRQKIQQLEQKSQTLENQLRNSQNALNNMQNQPTQSHPANLMFSDIKFVTNQTSLTAANRAALDQIANTLMSNSNDWRTIEINGYTDSSGSDATNLRLSQQRAQLVANYLMSKGISSSRISGVHGRGDIKPITSNATLAGRNQNRRVEIDVMR